MNSHELKALLSRHAAHPIRLVLPHGDEVPVSFHVTEVGRVHKSFVDCGGTAHESTTLQLQAWVGEDEDHRIQAGKLAAILDKASALIGDDDLPVEIEYQDRIISQYPVTKAAEMDGTLVLHLSTKHTDCLAKELCGVPAERVKENAASCCDGGGCCG